MENSAEKISVPETTRHIDTVFREVEVLIEAMTLPKSIDCWSKVANLDYKLAVLFEELNRQNLPSEDEAKKLNLLEKKNGMVIEFYKDVIGEMKASIQYGKGSPEEKSRNLTEMRICLDTLAKYPSAGEFIAENRAWIGSVVTEMKN